jgi:PAS domain S-box-containing protein
MMGKKKASKASSRRKPARKRKSPPRIRQPRNGRSDASFSRLALFIQNAPGALAMFDRQMCYLAASSQWLADYGLQGAAITGKSHYDLFPESQIEWNLIYQRGLAGEVVEMQEDQLVHADGTVQWLRWQVRPWHETDESIGGIVVYTEDITPQRQAEKALSESQATLDAALESTQEAVFITDVAGRFIHVNDAAARLFKAENRQALLVDIDDYLRFIEVYSAHGVPLDVENSPIAQALAGVQLSQVEYHFRRKDTSESWDASCSAAPIRNRDGQIVGSIVVAHDVTERKKAEARLRGYSEERLRAALDAAQMGTWEWDLKRGVVVWDARQFELFGFSSATQEIRVEQVFQAMHPEDQKRIQLTVNASQQEQQPFRDAFRVVLPDGTIRWIAGFGLTYNDEHGVPERTVGVNFDITEQKEAELELKRREARWRAVFENAFLGILTVDKQGVIENANQAVDRMLGYRATELVGQQIWRLLQNSNSDDLPAEVSGMLATAGPGEIGISRELKMRRKNGTAIDEAYAVSEIDDAGLLTVTLLDVTRQKQLEREVVEIASQEQHRIGQDLHDTVAQNVAGLHLMMAKLVQDLVANASPYAESAGEIADGLEQTKFDVRAILGGLIPVAVERRGLVYALQSLATRIHQPGRMACLFEFGKPVDLADHLVATHLFLIAQEAVLNAVKHSGASEVKISLTRLEEDVVLTIRDDGRGIAGSATRDQGVGMRIMMNRAAIIGATLTTESHPERGTVVVCRLRSDQ